jgi:hypothetical protein
MLSNSLDIQPCNNQKNIGLIGLLTGVVLMCWISDVKAIPSRDPHCNDANCITWSQYPIPPANPDTTNHQHNSNLDIRGANGSYDGYAVWDSERLLDGKRDMWRYPQGTGNAPILGVEDRVFGHGYIADDFISAIEYAFVGDGWTDQNKTIVNSAFQLWESEAKTRPNGSVVGQGGALIRRPGTQVGINFDEDNLFTDANFEIRWANIGEADLAAQWFPDDSTADPDPFDLELVFNTNTLFNNAGSTTDWLSDPEANEWDFYSVALHEVGHVLGLHGYDAGDGSNLMGHGGSSFKTGDKHRFIDTSDLQGAIDLYSIPVPEPSSILGLFAIGGLGLTQLRKKRQ